MKKTLDNLNLFLDNIKNKPYKLVSLLELKKYNERFRIYEGEADLLLFQSGEILGRYYSLRTSFDEKSDISKLDRKDFRENSLILGKAKNNQEAEVLKYYDIYPAPSNARHLYYPYCLGSMNFGHFDDSSYYFYPSLKDEDVISKCKAQEQLERINKIGENEELYRTEWPISDNTELYHNPESVIKDIADKCDRLADSLVKIKFYR